MTQRERVFRFVCDGRWRSLSEIAGATDTPETAVSARLRELRQKKFGAHVVENRFVYDGAREYRVLVNPSSEVIE